MLIMANEEKTNQTLILELFLSNSQPSVPSNQSLISALSACNIQPYVNALEAPTPSSGATTATNVTGNPPTQDTVATLSQAYPAKKIKLHIILKR